MRAGEIVGLGGLVGSGRTEVARVLFGIDAPDGGVIRLNGKVVRPGSAAEAMRSGIAYVSEDRLGQNLRHGRRHSVQRILSGGGQGNARRPHEQIT